MTKDPGDSFTFEPYIERNPWDRLPLLEEQWRDMQDAWLRMRGPRGGLMFRDGVNQPVEAVFGEQPEPPMPDGMLRLERWMRETRRQIEFVTRSASRPRYSFWRRWHY